MGEPRPIKDVPVEVEVLLWDGDDFLLGKRLPGGGWVVTESDMHLEDGEYNMLCWWPLPDPPEATER